MESIRGDNTSTDYYDKQERTGRGGGSTLVEENYGGSMSTSKRDGPSTILEQEIIILMQG